MYAAIPPKNDVAFADDEPLVYDPLANKFAGDVLDPDVYWNKECGRFAFFQLHQEKGMSSFSTMDFDDAKRKDSVPGYVLPREPTFVRQDLAGRCCGSKGLYYRQQCQQKGCLVKCPACDGGISDSAVAVVMCLACPKALALPWPKRVPEMCPCGVRLRFVVSTCALLTCIGFNRRALARTVCVGLSSSIV